MVSLSFGTWDPHGMYKDSFVGRKSAVDSGISSRLWGSTVKIQNCLKTVDLECVYLSRSYSSTTRQS